MRHAVLAEVLVLDLQFEISPMRVGQLRPIPDQALEWSGRQPPCVATELADDLADGFSPMLLRQVRKESSAGQGRASGRLPLLRARGREPYRSRPRMGRRITNRSELPAGCPLHVGAAG
jgi:hypothetical protein